MSIRKIIALIIALSGVTIASAQEEIDSVTQQRARHKMRNQDFAQQTLNYTALSFVSPPAVDRGSPKTWYFLSADIIPQFMIGGDWTRFVLHITPRYKVRIFHNDKVAGDSSLPVRTPSYMPGATLYVPIKFFNPRERDLYYASFSFFHHSNGQDGNEFNTDGTFNKYNGNFSTNFGEVAFHFVNRKDEKKVNKTCDDAQSNYWDRYGRAGLEFHVNTTDELKSSYGLYRLNLMAGVIRVINKCDVIKKKQVNESYYRERWRAVFNTTFIAGNRTNGLSEFKKRINADLNFYYRIPSSPNTSALISFGYQGSDTYNIYYEDSYFFVRIGLALGFFVSPNMIGLKRSDGRVVNQRKDFE